MKTCVIFFIFLVVLFDTKGQAPIQNGGFENWISTEPHAYETDLITLYSIPDVVSGEMAFWTTTSPFGTIRTTDAYSGDYALVLHNWYNYAWTSAQKSEKINSNITAIHGYFKYTGTDLSGVMASGTCEVYVKDALNDTIGSGTFTFNNQSDYTSFTVPITYDNGNSADSAIIKFTNASQSCPTDMVCNLLYLDEISYLTGSLSLKEVSVNSTFAYDALNNLIVIHNLWKNATLELIDLTGKIIYSLSVEEGIQTISLPNLNSGLYIVKIENPFCLETQKIVVNR